MCRKHSDLHGVIPINQVRLLFPHVTYEDKTILQVLYHFPIKSYHLYGKALVPDGTTWAEGSVTLKKHPMYFYDLKYF